MKIRGSEKHPVEKIITTKNPVVPDWARPGKIRFARLDGGEIEVEKARLSGWDYIRDDNNAKACRHAYENWILDLLEEAKINCIWVTWSVGFSPLKEHSQQIQLQQFIEKCHTRGIRVIAYLSLTNIFWEDMSKGSHAYTDYPKYTQIDTKKQPVSYPAALYTGVPSRYLACLNSNVWLQYLCANIESALKANVDGVHFDNLFSSCHCSRCTNGFNNYAKETKGRVFSIPNNEGMAVDRNVLAQAEEGALIENGRYKEHKITEAAEVWQEYHHKVITDILWHLAKIVYNYSPGTVVSCNAHQRSAMNEPCNLIFTEDTRKCDSTINNTELYENLNVQAKGVKSLLVEYSRGRDRFQILTLEETEFMIAEAASWGASFAVTPEGRFLTGLYYHEKPALDTWRVICEHFDFLQKHEHVYANKHKILRNETCTREGLRIMEWRNEAKEHLSTHLLSYARLNRNIGLEANDASKLKTPAKIISVQGKAKISSSHDGKALCTLDGERYACISCKTALMR